jgi:threonine dehydratase
VNDADLIIANDERPPDLDSIRRAAVRIKGRVHETPVVSSRSLDEEFGGSILFKCENLQRVGAFKARGAANAVFALSSEDAACGVATHSSGNHGAALALAAASRGIPCWVVVPDNAPAVKAAAVARYGATVVPCEPGLRNREAGLARVLRITGATPVHPYDDYRVIAGQGTTALEFLTQCSALDVLMTPVGGGGLIAGCAIAAKALKPEVRVIGCEPANADDAKRSFESGERVCIDAPDTVADGLRASLGARNFPIILDRVDDIVTVSEAEIIAAMRLVWERLKLVIEPSCAVPVAALMNGAVDPVGRTVGVVLTGGNVDLDNLPW